MKRTFAILVIAGICLAAAGLKVSHQKRAARAAQESAWQQMKAQREAELKAINTAARSAVTAPVFPQTLPPALPEAKGGSGSGAARKSRPNVETVPTTADPLTQEAKATTAAPPRAGKKGELKDPLAREALSFVGADPEAEAIWAEAINNPDLPPDERKDLIEDLNEDGFPDPKNITMDDLPLIVSRLALIEELADKSMDDVNWDAFREAYKDLAKMYGKLAGF